MNISNMLQQARLGRPDLAAMNLGAAGFSEKPLKVFIRYNYSDGERTSIKKLQRLYRHYKQKSQCAYCCN